MRRPMIYFSLSLAVFALDQLTKSLVEKSVSHWEVIPVIPGLLNVVHTQNRGIAFGIFAGVESPWASAALLAFSLVVVAFLSFVLWQTTTRPAAFSSTTPVAFALILGGAFGNVYDRLTQGAVTDFLDFHIGTCHWPAFNIADSAITLGAALLLTELWWSRKQVCSEAPES